MSERYYTSSDVSKALEIADTALWFWSSYHAHGYVYSSILKIRSVKEARIVADAIREEAEPFKGIRMIDGLISGVVFSVRKYAKKRLEMLDETERELNNPAISEAQLRSLQATAPVYWPDTRELLEELYAPEFGEIDLEKNYAPPTTWGSFYEGKVLL